MSSWLESLKIGSRVAVGFPTRSEVIVVRVTISTQHAVGYTAPCGRRRLFSRAEGKELGRPSQHSGMIFHPDRKAP